MVPTAHRFSLEPRHVKEILKLTPQFGFGGLGEAVYYRSYSRKKPDASQEQWHDTVLRVVNGVMSIRKYHYLKQGITWDEPKWQAYAARMVRALFLMEWMPAGRGLWAMGTEHVYQKGAMALYNCGACDTTDLSQAAEWAMDALMCGVGVGFNTAWEGSAAIPKDEDKPPFVIPDSREGWAESLRHLLDAYTKGTPRPRFDYSQIRPEGTVIKGLGGLSPGPGPLKKLHRFVTELLDAYCNGAIDKTRCVVDLFNAVGVCVVTGNVRRSAQIALGRIDDATLLSLKDYGRYPERRDYGWVSNNSVVLETPEDYAKLESVIPGIERNGEPGIVNLMNIRRYARFGEEKADSANLTNPCGEIPLESFELCNLAEAFPSRCRDEATFMQALEFATFYTSTVTLLPTHREASNAVIARNRRIGVSIGGAGDTVMRMGKAALSKMLRQGYERVKACNAVLAEEAGIPISRRLSTIKPSGTISLLAGVSPGMHRFPFRYAVRRMRVGNRQPICELLKTGGLAWEADRYAPDTTVFEFPLCFEEAGETPRMSARGQFELLALLQREWSDNMVSCTVSFHPAKEAILPLLTTYLPKIKSVSLLPIHPGGAYAQMPYEGIGKEEYERRVARLKPIDWSLLRDSDGEEGKFCYEGECKL